MKSLIIAEKPSLARNICAAITPAPKWVAGSAKNTGHYENDDYIVPKRRLDDTVTEI